MNRHNEITEKMAHASARTTPVHDPKRDPVSDFRNQRGKVVYTTKPCIQADLDCIFYPYCVETTLTHARIYARLRRSSTHKFGVTALELPESERAANRLSNNDVTWSKLAMEGDLLWNGTGLGLKQSWDKVVNDPKQAAINAGLVAGGSYALSIACQMGGKNVTKATQYIFGAALAYDLGSRSINTIVAMADAWHHPEHSAASKQAIADNLGEGAFDYAVNGTISAGAFKLASGNVAAVRGLFQEAKCNAMLQTDLTPHSVPVRVNERIVENHNLPEDSPLRQVWSTRKESVVRVESSNADGDFGGTGFFVDKDGLVATNYHVVSGLKDTAIITDDGQAFAARLVARDKLNDLALLRLVDAPAGTTFSPAPLDTISDGYAPVAVIGSPVEFYGAKVLSQGRTAWRTGWKRSLESSPFADLNPPAESYVRSRHNPSHLDYQTPPPTGELPRYIRRDVVVHNAPSSQGNSGSPVFNMNGDVLAIQTSCNGFSVHSKHLDAMIKQMQLTPPGDGWLDIRSHAEPAGWFGTTPAQVIRAKVRDRWSLATAVRDSIDGAVVAKRNRDFIFRRLNIIAGVDSIAARLDYLLGETPKAQDTSGE
jgi:S1-C subfamily serine protease